MSKVRAPSPRLDSVSRRTLFNRRWVASYVATLAFSGLSYWVVTRLSNFHQAQLTGGLSLGMFDIDWAVSVHELFIALIAFYAVVLILYYASYPGLRSTAFVFVRVWFSLTHVSRRARGGWLCQGTSRACRSRFASRARRGKRVSRSC